MNTTKRLQIAKSASTPYGSLSECPLEVRWNIYRFMTAGGTPNILATSKAIHAGARVWILQEGVCRRTFIPLEDFEDKPVRLNTWDGPLIQTFDVQLIIRCPGKIMPPNSYFMFRFADWLQKIRSLPACPKTCRVRVIYDACVRDLLGEIPFTMVSRALNPLRGLNGFKGCDEVAIIFIERESDVIHQHLEDLATGYSQVQEQEQTQDDSHRFGTVESPESALDVKKRLLSDLKQDFGDPVQRGWRE